MNPVVWFEIYVRDLERAARFYENVLGHALSPMEAPADAGAMEMRSFPMSQTAGGASGALVRMDGMPAGGGGTIVYFTCPDCAEPAGRIAAAGGTLRQPKTSIGPFGFMALGVDPDGNVFGMHSMA